MPRRFEHRAGFSAPAKTVYAALVDSGFLTERLERLGGKGATLVEHTTSADTVSFRLRQGLDAEHLPGAARAIFKGDLVVEREERWHPDGTGYVCTGRATISGVPGEITSRARLDDRADGSELVTTAEARVGIPLVGGKLEGVIAEQVGRLLTGEAEFAAKWLAERP